MARDLLRIGTGCSWWGDRIEPAKLNADHGDLDYLCFEAMAEVTISAAQIRKRRDPNFGGYDTLLEQRMDAVLPGCIRRGTKIISNQGWINPLGAAECISASFRKHGARGKKIAAVEGSLIGDRLLELAQTIIESGQPVSTLTDTLISAEAYLGAEPIVEALRLGADVVVTGRTADPSLFLAPMIYEFGWDVLDHEKIGAGSGIGHLMECSAQVTGGYFADPGFKDVPEPWNLAFPIAEVNRDGSAVITKVGGTGGAVNSMTVKEQLFYEIHDPRNYITPDVVVDFGNTKINDLSSDRVHVSGITGKPRTATLKASISCAEGFAAEDTLFHAGPGAMERVELARKILEERFKIIGLQAQEIRWDYLGINAIHGPISPLPAVPPYEVILRVSIRTKTLQEAIKLGQEFDAIGVNGPGMTGKRVPLFERTREVVGVWSALVPRDQVYPKITMFES
jgi:hypothetical protein